MKEKLLTYIKEHKKSIVIILILIVGVGYYEYNASKNSAPATSYVLGSVTKDNLFTSISATGQVSASSQIDIKPKVSANIVSIAVKERQEVKAGDTIMQLNDKDLKIELNNAINGVEVARANLNLKLAGATKEDIAISQNSIDSAKLASDNAVTNLADVKITADQNLKKAQLAVDNAERQYNEAVSTNGISSNNSSNSLLNSYDNAKTTLNSSLVSLRTAITAAGNILNTSDSDVKNLLGVQNIQSLYVAEGSYILAKTDLDNFEAKYNSVSVSWKQSDEDELLNTALKALQSMKVLEHNMYTLLSYTITSVDLTQTTLDSYKQSMSSQESSMISGINSMQGAMQAIANAKLGISSSGVSTGSSLATAKSNLVTAQNNYLQAVQDNKKNINTAQTDIVNKKIAYENAQAQYNLKVAKPRPEDLASVRAQLSQAENDYQAAQQNLADAKIVSPIDGVIAKISVSVGDEATAATAVATVITKDQLAVISLNEVDVAKVKPGQKATLTFSAFDGLSISGVVADVDTIGTITQGVVNYGVKIAFDTQDDRIKPEMSVSASVITDQKFDILLVASSAIKNDGNNYVEILSNPISSSAGGTSGAEPLVTSLTPPLKKYVQIGLSNDTDSEIMQGLVEGEEVVVKINSSATTATTAASKSGLGMFGGGGTRQGGGIGGLR